MAQLDKAPAYGAGDCEFESHWRFWQNTALIDKKTLPAFILPSWRNRIAHQPSKLGVAGSNPAEGF